MSKVWTDDTSMDYWYGYFCCMRLVSARLMEMLDRIDEQDPFVTGQELKSLLQDVRHNEERLYEAQVAQGMKCGSPGPLSAYYKEDCKL